MERVRPLRKEYYRRLISAFFFTFSLIFFFFVNQATCFAAGKTQKLETPDEPPLVVSAMDRLKKLIDNGSIEEAKTLFISEIQPNETDGAGRTALHFAAAAQNSALADFFIRLRTNVDTADNENNTPLNLSAALLDSKTAAILASANADIHHKPGDGKNTPAQTAILPGNNDFLAAILTDTTLQSTDDTGNTLLHLAAASGNAAAVETILKNARSSTLQAVINKKNSAGKTALDLCFLHHRSRSYADASAVIISAGGTSNDPFYYYFAPSVRNINYNLRSPNGFSPLHFAVREQYTGWVDYLLAKGADPNIKNAAGDTPLIETAKTGDIETMRKLLDYGAQPNIQNAQGRTAMHIDIPVDVHQDILKLLLGNNGNPNLRDAQGNTPLHIVITLNRPVDVVSVLLENRADVSIHNAEGKTPFFVAVEENRTSLISLLLRYKSDIFAVTNRGVTPFEKALQTNNAILEEIITAETVQRSDNGGNTPLIVAVRLRANPDIIRRILDKKANVNARNQEGDTALHFAVRLNDAAAGDLLLAHNADIFIQNAKNESQLYLTFHSGGGIRDWMFTPAVLKTKDGQDNTILHFVTQWKLDSVIQNIVARGANVNARNSLGETPLFVAVQNNSASTVRTLLAANASLTDRDIMGNTVLHTAVRSDAQSAAEALINAKININAYNLNGNTPLHEAVRLEKHPLENLLVQRGAQLEVRDSEGNTPLLCAVTMGNFRSTDHLVRSGADINARNNEGNTPLLIAVQNERSDLVSLLLDHGAQIHARDAEGESPFTTALRVSPRMVLTLLRTDRDQTDDEGRSPLHIALLAGKNEAEIKLITDWLGTKQLWVVDRQGKTPLRYAVDAGNWGAAKFLANAGSDVFSVARDGKTPADIAINSGKREAIAAVFDDGKAITSTDSSGNTALHYAAKIGSADVINFLLELGAVKNARNTAGETPADIAKRWGHSTAEGILQ